MKTKLLEYIDRLDEYQMRFVLSLIEKMFFKGL